MREHLLASSKTLPYSMAFTYQCTFCCDHCMGPTSKSRYQQTSVSRLNLEFKILTKPGFRISPKIQLHYLHKTSAAKYWPNSRFKSCLNFNFKILTKSCPQRLNNSLPLQNISSKILTKLLLQILPELQLQNLDQTLCSKSEQKFSFMTKPQLPNLQQTVANTILIINISNSNNLNKFWVGIFKGKSHINQVY